MGLNLANLFIHLGSIVGSIAQNCSQKDALSSSDGMVSVMIHLLHHIYEYFPTGPPQVNTSDDDDDEESAQSDQVIDLKSNIEQLSGKSLYWVNKNSIYSQVCLKNGVFSVCDFEYDITKVTATWFQVQWTKFSFRFQFSKVRAQAKLKPLNWRLCPKEAISKSFNENGEFLVDKTFHEYFSCFAKDYFQILGKLYPYDVPPKILTKFATGFLKSYPELSDLFFAYKEKFPKALMAECEDAIVSNYWALPLSMGHWQWPNQAFLFNNIVYFQDMFERKLENKFINRSAQLKKLRFWPYRPHERSKDKECNENDADEEDRSDGKRRKKTYRFPYAAHKPFLYQRMDMEAAKKQEDKEKKKAEAAKNKRSTKRKAPECPNENDAQV